MNDESRKMITMEWGATLFQFRAAALIRSNGHILIHRDTKADFWVLPGGRVEFGEMAAQALQREMLEELGSASLVGPLRIVIELYGDTETGTLQEIGFYFDVQLLDPPPFHESDIVHTCRDGDADLEYRWVRPTAAQLSQFHFRPAVLSERLSNPLMQVMHLTVNETSKE